MGALSSARHAEGFALLCMSCEGHDHVLVVHTAPQ
jgi:hypothetical protein